MTEFVLNFSCAAVAPRHSTSNEGDELRPLHDSVCVVTLAILPARASHGEGDNVAALVTQLNSPEATVARRAEAELVRIGKPAVAALVAESCRDIPASDRVMDAVLRILKQWDERSWTHDADDAAIDEFVRLARDDARASRKRRPLSPQANAPFAERVRVLDLSRDEALREVKARQIEVRIEANGDVFVNLSRWKGPARELMYVANLAPTARERRLALAWGQLEHQSPEFVTECLKYLRKARDASLDLNFTPLALDREGWRVLSHFPGVVALWIHHAADDVRDDHIAAAIANFPNATALSLPPAAGQQTVAAAAKLRTLKLFRTRNETLRAADLEPLRRHPNVEYVGVFDGTAYVGYRNADGTGKWDEPEQPK